MWFAPAFRLYFRALVGGNWANGTNAGLWYWNVNEASSNTWTNVGARLLISFYKYRDLMCLSAWFVALIALVGGRYDNGAEAGLWYWNCNNDSSLANFTVGARLLILGFGVFCTDSF